MWRLITVLEKLLIKKIEYSDAVRIWKRGKYIAEFFSMCEVYSYKDVKHKRGEGNTEKNIEAVGMWVRKRTEGIKRVYKVNDRIKDKRIFLNTILNTKKSE